MRIADYLKPELVRFLQGRNKNECLKELADAVLAAGEGPDRNGLHEAIFHREELMSTGIGLGIGVPHVRIEGINRPCIAVGIHSVGLRDYESLDGKPVRIIVLIVAGKEQHSQYIQLLAQVTSLLKRQEVRDRIVAARDPAEVYRTFTESDGG